MLQIVSSLKNSFNTPQSVTKHSQVQHIKIIKRFAVEGVYYQFLNIISTFLKLVTIHGKGNNLVWVVVNCKIPLIEIFYNKEQALALVSILHAYERKHFKKNITHTIYVQRETDRLTGIIPRSDK